MGFPIADHITTLSEVDLDALVKVRGESAIFKSNSPNLARLRDSKASYRIL